MSHPLFTIIAMVQTLFLYKALIAWAKVLLFRENLLSMGISLENQYFCSPSQNDGI